eukprot:TRINITY_DN18720_c0_g1_i2.p1 TRINITY_DN18720_c0_g1~~TRINITY_DN18720_c0_g1_i2.p1  ORF type:complete len:841 (-),score=189.37 TRINITY_DN18720_c0_g1_i2:9-2531(-)
MRSASVSHGSAAGQPQPVMFACQPPMVVAPLATKESLVGDSSGVCTDTDSAVSEASCRWQRPPGIITVTAAADLPPPPAAPSVCKQEGAMAASSQNGRRLQVAGSAPSTAPPPQVLPSPTQSSAPSEAGPAAADADGSRFYKAVIRRLFVLYAEPKKALLLRILSEFDVEVWHQLLTFTIETVRFLVAPAAEGTAEPPVPQLPLDVLGYLLAAYATGHVRPLGACRQSAPLWYLETMLTLRLLMCPPASLAASPQPPVLRPPPRIVQVLVQLASSNAAAAAVGTIGVLLQDSDLDDDALIKASRATLERHLGDLLLAAQHTLFRLYPPAASAGAGEDDEQGAAAPAPQEGARRAAAQQRRGRPLSVEETPSAFSVVLCAALHFSSHLLMLPPRLAPDEALAPSALEHADGANGVATVDTAGSDSSRSSSMEGDGDGGAAAAVQEGPQAVVEPGGGESADSAASQQTAALPQHPHTPLVSRLLGSIRGLGQPPQLTLPVADRFMLSLRDVLETLLGPAPARPQDLPDPVPALSAGAERLADETIDIRTVMRVARTVVKALFTNATLLAAWKAGRSSTTVLCEDVSPIEASPCPLSAGAFNAPSEPMDFVPAATNKGPLRRSLAFMEQSPILQVVQNRLCSAQFKDFQGSTKQLSLYALRNLRVLWFDLRRCTSTLKRDPEAVKARVQSGHANGVLVLKNLRLGLAHDWEATLGTFPYLSADGGSQVSVRSLNMHIRLVADKTGGITFAGLDVSRPELDVQLSCSRPEVQAVLSLLLVAFQTTLQEQLQQQLRQHLLTTLQAEAERWNDAWWRPICKVVPASLISQAIDWFSSNMPVEGLPI